MDGYYYPHFIDEKPRLREDMRFAERHMANQQKRWNKDQEPWTVNEMRDRIENL